MNEIPIPEDLKAIYELPQYPLTRELIERIAHAEGARRALEAENAELRETKATLTRTGSADAVTITVGFAAKMQEWTRRAEKAEAENSELRERVRWDESVIPEWKQRAETAAADAYNTALNDSAVIESLRATLAEREKEIEGLITQRDVAENAADALAYAIGTVETIGEHTNLNSPWATALEMITSWEEVERLKSSIESWQETAEQHCRNEMFYRSIVIQIGEPFGVAAKTSDDGSIQEDVLALRVPELVESLRSRLATAREAAIRDVARILEENKSLLLVNAPTIALVNKMATDAALAATDDGKEAHVRTDSTAD